jgi:glycosyltransferase involved in cell wall biosynthesis
MKILFLSHNFYPFIGGIEVISKLLADAFADAGHDVHMLTWTPYNGDDKQFSYKISRKPGLLTLTKAHAWADVVFENNVCLRLSWPALFFNSKSVIALHTWISRITGEKGLQDRLKFLWLKRAANVIAVSQALREESWKEAIVIGNPYRAKEFRILPDVERSKAFVFLGRLVSDKGVDLAIKALHKFKIQHGQIRENKEDFKFTIIGEGPEMQNLKTLVADLDLTHDVIFRGSLTGNDLVQALNEHKVLLVPSKWKEPFGVVVLEGQACGCIPIASDGGGLADAVGDAGLLFQRDNVEDLVSKMELLIQNQQVIEDFKGRAEKHLRKFHPKKVTLEYLNAIVTSHN